jgi:protein-S-isoprenylcysteine O-methyltransferase Ste14
MRAVQQHLFSAMWIAWLVYWWLRSYDVKTTVRRESTASRLQHVVPLTVAALLLWSPRFPVPVLDARFLPLADWPFWLGAALTAAGLLFTVWARVELGRNWSAIVTVKESHELVTTGPYALVRHPIYTGLLLAFIGSAIARGEWRGVLAVAIAWIALWRKLSVEEQWMKETFGDAYREYSRRVAALVPFLW